MSTQQANRNNVDIIPDEVDSSDSNMPFSGVGMSLHEWLKGAYYRDISLQSDSRKERAIDADFYDDEQFTTEEKAQYEEDGRMPPLQYNIIKQTINWILGSYLRQTYDWNVLPRTEDDVEPAIRKTKLCKYIADINNSQQQEYLAFCDAVKVGEGWREISVIHNEDGDEQIKVSHVPWRDIILDSSCRKPDLSDASRIFRTKIVDVEQLIAMFPDNKAALKVEAEDRDTLESDYQAEVYQEAHDTKIQSSGSLFAGRAMSYDGVREAIRVVECWYKYPIKAKILRGEGKFKGSLFEKDNPEHLDAIQRGEVTIVETIRQQVFVAIFTDKTLLYSGKSPYKHNRFPFVRSVAYIKDKTGLPYGAIRALRDPQMSMNIRRNKALQLLSVKRVIKDDNALPVGVTDADLENEVSRPDSIITVTRNSRFEIVEAQSLAESHVRFAQEDESYIRQTSGVTGENLGMSTNATSGIAIQARQEQGTVSTLFLFENASWAFEQSGRLVLSLIEQFMSRPMQFRITSDTKDKEFVSVNDGENDTDITRTQSDFVVKRQNYHSTIRQALAEALLPLSATVTQATGNPQAAFGIIESAIGLTDIPNKESIMQGLRKSMGLPDPDETPEEKAAREQSQADAQAKQQAMMEQKFAAELAKLQAEARRADADANRTNIAVIADKLNSLKSGIEVAGLAATNPELSETVDDLLKNLDSILMINNQNANSQAVGGVM